MTRERLLRVVLGRCKGDSEGHHRSEAGDTLVEVLLAVVVLGLASVALMIAFGTSISASSEHRNLSTANTILTSASQQAISLIQQQKSVFETCYTTETATVSAYQGNAAIAMTVPAPYTTSYSVAYTEVEYWNGTTFNPVSASGPATPCVPLATQLITITVTENSNGSHYTNSFVVNFPLASSVANASGAATQLVWLIPTELHVAGRHGAHHSTGYRRRRCRWCGRDHRPVARHLEHHGRRGSSFWLFGQRSVGRGHL
jgi:type II secretory pathway pseudopilin PulG